MNNLLIRGSSQNGDHSQRKKPQTRMTATGRKKTRIGLRVRTPVAKDRAATKKMVGKATSRPGRR